MTLDDASILNPCASAQVANNALAGNNPVPVPQTPATPAKILEANSDRKEIIIQNVSAVVVYIGLGFQPTATSYSVALQQCGATHDGTGGVYVSDNWKGAVYAIGAIAGGLVAITEEV